MSNDDPVQNPGIASTRGLLLARGHHLAAVCLLAVLGSALLACFSRPFLTVTDPFPPAPHPPMGWNTWYAFGPDISDALVRREADQLIANGMRQSGYEYVTLNDGWQGLRDSAGVLHPNDSFPDMRSLSDYLHSRGLKFGIYTSMGPQSCGDNRTGSLGYEEQDAKMFLSWNADFVTYDPCHLPDASSWELEALAYKNSKAIREHETHPVIVNTIVLNTPWQWGPGLAVNMWRIAPDALDSFENMLQIADADAPLAPFVIKTGWNDPDMLQVGLSGMTTDEYRTHMTLWAMLAAPLVSSADLLTISPEDLEILKNPDVIAIDQDPLVQQAVRVAQQGNIDVWLKTLSQGWAIAAVNRNDQPAQFTASPNSLAITATQGLDVWAKQAVSLPYTVTLPAHGCVLMRTK